MMFGVLGKLESDGYKNRCHICGKWFHHLGCHVYKKHGISADDYREKYGLNRTTSLASPVFQQTQRQGQTPRLSKYWGIGKAIISNQTIEQRSRKLPPRLQGNISRAAMNRRPAKIAALKLAAQTGMLSLLSDEAKRKSALAHQTPEAVAKAREKVLSGQSPLLRPDVKERAQRNAQSPAARAKRIASLNSLEVKMKRSGENSHNKRPEMRRLQFQISKRRRRIQGRFASN